MTYGFQNKYYFFKETDHPGTQLTKNSPGYISFWESNGLLKINILLENILIAPNKVEAYLKGGKNTIKIAEFSFNKKTKNNTYNTTLSFKIKLPETLLLNNFDTAYIKESTAQGNEIIFETHSQGPCPEEKKNIEEKRETEFRKQSTPDIVFSDLKQFDPFNTTNNAYKWWICENYKRVCDTLHKMDIHLPGYIAKTLYANMQFFKHSILGRYTTAENRCFVIVGIPVENLPQINSPQSPARPMACRHFINNSGYKGYLLFYIDYTTTALVKAVVV